jgi:hypothetical protein
MTRRGLGVLALGIVVGYVGSFGSTWLSLRRIDRAPAARRWRWAS